jgi:hypothetical protein
MKSARIERQVAHDLTHVVPSKLRIEWELAETGENKEEGVGKGRSRGTKLKLDRIKKFCCAIAE